jgi:hypothetical protein
MQQSKRRARNGGRFCRASRKSVEWSELARTLIGNHPSFAQQNSAEHTEGEKISRCSRSKVVACPSQCVTHMKMSILFYFYFLPRLNVYSCQRGIEATSISGVLRANLASAHGFISNAHG